MTAALKTAENFFLSHHTNSISAVEQLNLFPLEKQDPVSQLHYFWLMREIKEIKEINDH